MKKQILMLISIGLLFSSNVFAYKPSNVVYKLYEEHRNTKNIEKGILSVIYKYFLAEVIIDENHNSFIINSSIETLELIKKNHYFRNIFEKTKYIIEKKYIEINDTQYVFSEDQLQFINNIIQYYKNNDSQIESLKLKNQITKYASDNGL